MTKTHWTLARLWHDLAVGLQVMNRIQFSAPWRRQRKGNQPPSRA